MFTAIQRIRVEWAHCDPAGIIFNPNYYIWMDSGSHGLLQSAGFDFIAATRDNHGFRGCPLVASSMEFSRPLYFGDVITLASRVEKFGNTSFVVAHTFTRLDDAEPVAQGTEVRVWGYSDPQDPGKLSARPLPANIKGMLSVPETVDVSV